MSLRFVFVVLVVVATACAGVPVDDAPADMPADFPNHEASEIRDFLSRDDGDIQSFRAQGRLTMESPGQSGRFSANLEHRRNDSLFISLSPGLGIVAARALVTPDSFFVYERINSRLTYGALEDADELLPAPLLQENLIENLLGLLRPDQEVDWQVDADGLHYRLTAPDQSEMYIVDPRRWRVVRYERRDEAGALIEERTFSDYTSVEDKSIPRRVMLQMDNKESTLAINYRDIDLNPDDLNFDIRAEGASERVLLSRSLH